MAAIVEVDFNFMDRRFKGMEIFGRYFELTLNLLATPFSVTVVGGLIVWGVKKVVSAMINSKELRDAERHESIVNNLTVLCDQNREDHKTLFNKLDKHEGRISYLEGVRNGTSVDRRHSND